jgi:hypothetical protein
MREDPSVLQQGPRARGPEGQRVLQEGQRTLASAPF